MNSILKRILHKRKAFTLIELLIVIAIIAILTVAFLPTLRGGQVQARDAARKSEANEIAVAIERITNGDFTALGNILPAQDPGTCLAYTAGSVGDKIRTALSRNPVAQNGGLSTPVCTSGYFYRSFGPASSPTNYIIVTQLEQAANGNLYAASAPTTEATLNTALGGAAAPGTWSTVLSATNPAGGTQQAFWVVSK